MIHSESIACVTSQQEKELARLANSGNAEARERLIMANIKFVASYAKQFQGYGLAFEELMGYGIIGLIEAIDHFDAERGFRIVTYAKFWIRREILKALNECGSSIRLSDDKARKVIKIRKSMAGANGILDQEERVRFICESADCTEEEFHTLMSLSQPALSLDVPSDDDGESNIGSFIADTERGNFEESFAENEMRKDILSEIARLKSTEKEIISLHYGLTGASPLPLSKIALHCGKTKSRVQQIEKKAFEFLKCRLKAIGY